MALQIRSENDLPTLRIFVAGPAHEPEAVFQVTRGREAEVSVARLPLKALGIPETIDGSRWPARIPDLPAWLLTALREPIAGVGLSPASPESALWLEMPAPRGYLYLLPWERLLAPLHRTIIRLPNFLLRPQIPGDTLTVMLAVLESGRNAEKAVSRLCSAWAKNSHRRVRIHVFADFRSYPALRRMWGHDDDVTVHAPTAPDPAEPDPWLTWVRTSLRSTAVDVVQVVAPGTFQRDRGGVVLPIQPGAWDSPRRVVSGVELADFAGRLGAWCVSLAAVSAGANLPALIELADSVAREKPMVVMVQDLIGRLGQVAADRGVQLVCGDPSRVTGPLPTTTCWLHPAFLGGSGQQQDWGVGPAGNSTMVESATVELLGRADTPDWLAAGTRYLEERQSRWLPTADSALPGGIDDEALAALGEVGRLLERHARDLLSGNGV